MKNSFNKGFIDVDHSPAGYHPLLNRRKLLFLPGCLPFGKADGTTSAALSRPCGKKLQLQP